MSGSDSRDAVTRKRFGQHFLEPRVGRQGDPRHRAAAGRDVPRDRPGPRRADAAAAPRARTRAGVRDRSRPRRGPARDRARQPDRRRGRLPRRHRRAAARRAGDSTRLAPARSASPGNLPYNVASPILFKLVELYAAGVPLVDATRHAAARGRRPAASPRRAAGLRRPQRPDRPLGARVERLLALPPGAFRPPPKVHSALVRLRFHAPRPAGARRAGSSPALVQADLHAAAQDAGECPARLPAVGAALARPRRWNGRDRRPPAAGNADDRGIRPARRRASRCGGRCQVVLSDRSGVGSTAVELVSAAELGTVSAGAVL